MQNRVDEQRIMRLTQDEAIGLLELVMTCPLDLSPEQRSAMVKLSEFCRQGIRDDASRPDRLDKEIRLSSAVAA